MGAEIEEEIPAQSREEVWKVIPSILFMAGAEGGIGRGSGRVICQCHCLHCLNTSCGEFDRCSFCISRDEARA